MKERRTYENEQTKLVETTSPISGTVAFVILPKGYVSLACRGAFGPEKLHHCYVTACTCSCHADTPEERIAKEDVDGSSRL